MMKSQTHKNKSLLPVLLVCVFAVSSYYILTNTPQVTRSPLTYTKPSVEVIDNEASEFEVFIKANGLIKPVQHHITLVPQVSGMITATHPNFIPGGHIPKGEVIIQIDPTDYLLKIEDAKAQLQSAMASFQLEEGEQRYAKSKFDSYDKKQLMDENGQALALRKPQLEKAKSELVLAQNHLTKTQLDLTRTKLVFPFDVLIMSTEATVGEVISTGGSVSELVRFDGHWVELKVLTKFLSRIQVKTDSQAGAMVSFTANGHTYQGEVISILPNLVSSTRMAGVIAKVEAQPLELAPALLIETHVTATIDAGTILKAIQVPSEVMIDESHIYVVDQNSLLQIRTVETKWHQEDMSLVKANLLSGDQIAISKIFGITPNSEVMAIHIEKKLHSEFEFNHE